MESNTILNICFVLLLTENFAISILVGNERKEGKADPRTEELEWITLFAPERPSHEKSGRQISISHPNSLCPSGITGQFPYPPDCKRFINCWKGRGMIQVCAPGTLFNPAKGECDYPDKVKCVQGEGYASNPQPLVTRFPVARPPIAVHHRESRKDKDNYKTETFAVGSNTGRPPYFGPGYLTRSTPRTRPTLATRDKLQEKVSCPPGSAGLYPHPADCTRFLNCWAGRMFIQKCGPGTYFNPEMSVCDHASAISCSHNELNNSAPEVQNENVQHPEPTEEQSELKENFEETKSSETEPSPPDDSYNSATNLFDVRAGAEEDRGPEEMEKESVSFRRDHVRVDGNKDRDPSWGKILNFGNKMDQSDGGKLFYDADGNPINSDQFLTHTGRPYSNTPDSQKQTWNYRPQHEITPGEEQSETHRPQRNDSHTRLRQDDRDKPQYNTPHFGESSVYGKPENGDGIPGESNVYYLRPHNHVMNRHPPQLQHNRGSNTPVYRNPQFYPQINKMQTDRPPAFNPHYTSPTPIHTVASGHFILVSEKVPVDAGVVSDRHQTDGIKPAAFLVPPQRDVAETSDSVASIQQPSRFLLPPRESDSVNGRPTVTGAPTDAQFNFDYGGWKPFFAVQSPAYTNASETPREMFESVDNAEKSKSGIEENKKMTGENVGSLSDRDRWTSTTGNVNILPVKDQIIPATTYRPSSDNWPVYHGNKNPYGFSTRTTLKATTAAPATATNRLYVVYPVKSYEINGTSRDSFHKSKIDSVKRESYESSQKANEDEFKKRIKSEVDASDSAEDLKVRDVEMYTPTLEDVLPNASNEIRLKPLSNHLDGYIEMKNPNGDWGLVCDKDYGWMINEANLVCKQLGYARGAQISWQGYPLDSSSESIPVSVSEVTCNGDEEILKDCRIIYGDNGCDITKNAVGLRCFDNITSQCHPEEVEFNNSCYRIVKRDDLDDGGLTLEEAAEYCNKIGGRISDVISQEENNFISEWLMEKHPEVRSVLTGGIGSAFMGRSLWMWFGSRVPMIYQNWWKGWAEEKKIKYGTVHEPSCVVLRKSYPCFIQNGDEEDVELGNVEPEYCSANYFYWDIEECKKLKELKMPYLCKKPLEEIGCVSGRGEDYSGTASITSSGLPCLPWDDPQVKEKLAHRITLQEWSTKLSGHNFCRNMGRQELHPWCFVRGKENSEYCSIPQCWDSVPGYSKSGITSSSCDETEFECRVGECIKRNWFCDGKKDCSNGRDEAMCNIFLGEFEKMDNRRMKGHGKEKWPQVNENSCAKLCLENKKFKCKSFSYDKVKRNCLLSEKNIGVSGEVIHELGWSYYELSVMSVNCSADDNLTGCKNGKCVNVTNICDGKDNCGDGSDEVDCDRIDYQIRLTGTNQTNKGRIEVKSKWGAVCDDKFNVEAGEVVCRELGFKQGVSQILHNFHVSEENPVFMVDDLQCIGNETSIRECSFPGWGTHDCKPDQSVGVECRISTGKCSDDEWNCNKSKECIPVRFLCDSIADCDDGSDEDENMCEEPIKLRLSGGPNSTAGRLEIRYLGTWGTICDDNFNDAAANVICRFFGYHGPSYALKNAYFGAGSGPIWLDGIRCFGNESNVSECDHSGWGKHNCKHDEDVSISCGVSKVHQKSSATKPIAVSSDRNLELSSAAKLNQVLIRECNDRNGSVQSISVATESRARVVGSDVIPHGIPWQGSVRVRSPGGKSSHWCGAIIISPYHVLTAGHCLRDYSKPAYFIRVGDFDTEVEDEEEQEFGIDHMYIHPEFNRKLHLNNDIALVKVKGEIRFGERVKPACLAPSSDIYLPGTNCSISGWGSISAHSSGYARTLRRGFVPILEPSVCSAPFVYGNSLSDGMFCAGKLDGGVDSCQGDSGGPIMCEYEGKLYLYGITSWGHGCGRANKPGVYTNVAYYSEWIQEKIFISLG